MIERTQKPARPDVPPVPWRVDDEEVVSFDDWVVLEESSLPFNGDGLSRRSTLEAIVEAVNAYYAPAVPEQNGGAS